MKGLVKVAGMHETGLLQGEEPGMGRRGKVSRLVLTEV